MEENKLHMEWERQWLEGKLSDEEAKKSCPNPEQFEKLNRLVTVAQQIAPPQHKDVEMAWEELQQKINTSSSAKIISISRRNWLIGVAASFILAFGAYFLLLQNTPESFETFATAQAETQEVNLPDGSVVYLNAESSISFSTSNWEDARSVELTGEAFFEVIPGSTFQVVTQTATVEVLGTSFNVKEREDKVLVACKTGKVKVQTSAEEQILTPGMSLTATRNSLSEIKMMNVSHIDGWRRGEIRLDRTLLYEVFEELERQFGVEVVYDAQKVQNSSITTFFNKNNLTEAVQMVGLPAGLNFEVKDNEVRFFPK